jgi:AcrR family transcriptional regulator
MPRSSAPTRQAILDAAYGLFLRKGFVRVSMDEIAASAAVTKRTLYYHFTSKDLLLAEVLEAQHALALAAFRTFGEGLTGSPESIIDQLFKDLAVWSDAPRWAGSGFTRLVIELADLRGHPARLIARRHNARRSSGGPFGKGRCGVITRTRPRNLAAFRGRNRPDSYPWRPQLRCGGRGSGQETDPLGIYVQNKSQHATDTRRAKEIA